MSTPPTALAIAAVAPSGELWTVTVLHGSDRADKGEMPVVTIYASPQAALASVLDDFAPERAYADDRSGAPLTDEACATKALSAVGIYVEILAQRVMS